MAFPSVFSETPQPSRIISASGSDFGLVIRAGIGRYQEAGREVVCLGIITDWLRGVAILLMPVVRGSWFVVRSSWFVVGGFLISLRTPVFSWIFVCLVCFVVTSLG